MLIPLAIGATDFSGDADPVIGAESFSNILDEAMRTNHSGPYSLEARQEVVYCRLVHIPGSSGWLLQEHSWDNAQMSRWRAALSAKFVWQPIAKRAFDHLR